MESFVGTPSVLPSPPPSPPPSPSPSFRFFTTPSPYPTSPTSALPSVPASPTISCSEEEALFKLTLVTDNYALETSWSLSQLDKPDAALLFSNEEGYESFKEYTWEECLPSDQCYIFEIKDEFGDGICCSVGEGSYTVWYDGTEVGSGGEFGKSESLPMGNCPPTSQLSTSPSSVPSLSLQPTTTNEKETNDNKRERERKSLQALFDATEGEQWDDNTGWIGEPLVNHCEWKGIECSPIGFVKRITLSSNGLGGTLPTELGRMLNLLKLDLTNNDIQGAIPTELGMMSNLLKLDLTNNDIQGAIPTELGMMSNLQQLFLFDNGIQGTIPTELGMMSNLTVLHLTNNDIQSAIPTELAMMLNLQYFFLDNNDIQGAIPTELGMMSNLRYLSLGINDIQGTIPTELGMMSNLESLLLRNNDIQGAIPTELAMMSNVKYLYLDNNDIQGTIPTELGIMSNLEHLVLRNNDIQGTIPTELGMILDLQILHLDNNDIQGTIPTELGMMSNLQKLDLDNNDIQGAILTELGMMSNVKYLYLDNNNINVTIPSELGMMSNLLELHLNNNDIQGTFPTELGMMSNLLELHLHNNVIQGTFPTEIIMLSSLQGLSLCENDIQGTIPTEIGMLSSLQYLELGNNHINGLIPTELGNLSDSLVSFNASHNNLDSFPFEGKWNVLEICDVSHNEVIGTLPNDMALLSSIKELSLSNNRLYGTLPNSVRSLTYMENLYLDDNYFYGTITDGLLSLMRLRELNLSYNSKRLCFWDFECDEVISEIKEGDTVCCQKENGEGACSDRVETDITALEICLSTGFSGEIPASFGYTPYLKLLDLSSNYLRGNIPAEIGSLSRLRLLDVSSNILTGSIPTSLGALQDAALILKNNKFGNQSAPLSVCSQVTDFDLVNISRWCPPERNHLKAFYKEAKGQEWTVYTGWADEYSSHCDWYGVTCNNGTIGNVTQLVLKNSGLSGCISNAITSLTSLEVLDLHDNNLQGSIPDKIGQLVNLSSLRLSYNDITGTVPHGISNLLQLELLHLHSNQLLGNVTILSSSGRGISSFISDCGSPSDYDTPLYCPNCTMCCNTLQLCEVQRSHTNFVLGAIIFAVCVVALLLLAPAMKLLRRMLFTNSRRRPADPIFRFFHATGDEYDHIGKESAYSFLLSSSPFAWLFAICSLSVQVICYSIFVKAASLEFGDDKDWVYSFLCPRNSDECYLTSDVSSSGWVFFSAFIAVYVIPDMVNGFRLVLRFSKYTVSRKGIQCLFGGVSLFTIAALALYAGLVFNLAISRSNVDLIVNTVVLIFVNELDEQVYESLNALSPKWVEKIQNEIENTFSSRADGEDANVLVRSVEQLGEEDKWKDNAIFEQESTMKQLEDEQAKKNDEVLEENHLFEISEEEQAKTSYGVLEQKYGIEKLEKEVVKKDVEILELKCRFEKMEEENLEQKRENLEQKRRLKILEEALTQMMK